MISPYYTCPDYFIVAGLLSAIHGAWRDPRPSVLGLATSYVVPTVIDMTDAQN